MAHLIYDTFLWPPLHGRGYQFWSGIGSDITEITILFALAAWWHSHHCHIQRCWRIAWHPHPKHGHPVCRRHHPDTGKLHHDPEVGTTRIEQERKLARRLDSKQKENQ